MVPSPSLTSSPRRRTGARTRGRRGNLAAAELSGVGYQFFEVYAANVRKVTPADVQHVARQYLGTLRTVIVQPQCRTQVGGEGTRP